MVRADIDPEARPGLSHESRERTQVASVRTTSMNATLSHSPVYATHANERALASTCDSEAMHGWDSPESLARALFCSTGRRLGSARFVCTLIRERA
ncbi:uncharacterized protein LAESUDRAFT_765250 [Laetiporus sulphureus 93-53]|uniref:Uncharacterized protein n=1 Tax=Laetiporus sulphureus 93-53 TaxID=1314785 RepID=A0A165AUZ5_9APHY|nr:uncharacterized protein LAESUDRAFT_765250 [Laetiporus sulphureus 93-53]KZS99712.1 hypothetical protein LAESUDRAFT_765250 [Laetiporus sulphureus 93-53]